MNNRVMRIAILVINKNGEKLAKRLNSVFKDAAIIKIGRKTKGKLACQNKESTDSISKVFDEYDGLIFIAALGIVVRLISPFVKNKLTDPAVVCVDTAGRFSISVLSGHQGGANGLSFLAAGLLDALAVVTTGVEVHKKIIIGIGCRKNITSAEVKEAVFDALKKKNINLKEIRLAATVDFKNGEKGLIKACSELGLPLVFVQRGRIENFKGSISSSEVAKRRIGLEGVCEPCALLAGRRTRLILKKRISGRVTVAIARES